MISLLRTQRECRRMVKNRLIRFIVLVAVGLVLGGFIALAQIYAGKGGAPGNGGGPGFSSPPMAGVQIGGPFTLVDQDGKTVTEKDFPGFKLIYFGFTFCPSVCPTELQKITLAMDALGKAGDSVQPVFITIDPERDTVPVMREYVKLFHPRLVGLTGSREQIDATIGAYRVYAAKVQEEGMSDYTMDHSSFIYLMSPDDRLLAIYKTQDKADDMAKDIAARIKSES